MKYNLSEEQVNAFLDEISNPALRNLFKLMLNNQQQEEERKETTPSQRIRLNKAVEDVKHLLKINTAMKTALGELKSENEKLVERYRKLTKALGACECLGEDVLCPICHGKGTSGNSPIDTEAFNTYVYPLIQKITQTAEAQQWPKEKQHSSGKTNGTYQQN